MPGPIRKTRTLKELLGEEFFEDPEKVKLLKKMQKELADYSKEESE